MCAGVYYTCSLQNSFASMDAKKRDLLQARVKSLLDIVGDPQAQEAQLDDPDYHGFLTEELVNLLLSLHKKTPNAATLQNLHAVSLDVVCLISKIIGSSSLTPAVKIKSSYAYYFCH